VIALAYIARGAKSVLLAGREVTVPTD
jgi:hypothetical protein